MIPNLSLPPFTQAIDGDGLRRTLQAINAWAGVVNTYFRQYQEIDFDTADGRRIRALVKDIRGATETTDYSWFAITDISVADGRKIRVADGKFTAPDIAGIDSATPTIATLAKEISVSGGDFDVVDGSKVFLKLTVTATDGAFIYAGTGITVTNKEKVWVATAGEIVVQTSDPTNSDTESYILLADITIAASGAMTIKRRVRGGAIDTQSVTAAYGDTPTVDSQTRTTWFTITATEAADTFHVAEGRVYINSNGTTASPGSVNNKPQILSPPAENVEVLGAGYICLKLVYEELLDEEGADDVSGQDVLAFTDAGTGEELPASQVDSNDSMTPIALMGTTLWSKVRIISLGDPQYIWTASPDETTDIILGEVFDLGGGNYRVEQRHDCIVSIFPGPHYYGNGGD